MATAETLLIKPETEERQTSKLWAGVRSANWLIKVCFVILVALVLVALLAPVLATHDPNAQSLLSRLKPAHRL